MIPFGLSPPLEASVETSAHRLKVLPMGSPHVLRIAYMTLHSAAEYHEELYDAFLGKPIKIGKRVYPFDLTLWKETEEDLKILTSYENGLH